MQPWFPRFQNVLSSDPGESENQQRQTGATQIEPSTGEFESDDLDSPEQTKLESLISPSPLVSWRADCTIERGRQLFLLTPLPMLKALSSKHQGPSKSMFERITSNATAGPPSFFTISEHINDDLLDGVPIRPTPRKPFDSVATEMGNTLQCEFASSPLFSKQDRSMLVMTPCLKMSPPKSCVLLEPISESSHQGYPRVHKSTPYPVGIHCSSPQRSGSSGSDTSEGLALKYPELLGIQQAYKPGIGKKKVDASSDWFVSPPKTCVLLNPPDEKSLKNADDESEMLIASHVLNEQMNLSLSKEDDVQCSFQQTNNSCNQGIVFHIFLYFLVNSLCMVNTIQRIKVSFTTEPLAANIAFMKSTPMWKEPESMIRRGRVPGENTLKKELWTKFEAASVELRFNASVRQHTAQKGFLDLLDEASCDEES